MPRDTLTREHIVRAAIELLDEEGLEGLSMRRLGERLDSAATAAYWHVKSKDELVVLAGDAVFYEIQLPDPGGVGWRAAATTMATDAYSMITRHLWLVPAMSSHLVYGPGKARFDNHAITVYEAGGFVGSDADWAIETVFTFVLGKALGEAANAAWRARLRREGGDEQERFGAATAHIREIADGFPNLQSRMEVFNDYASGRAFAGSFEFGLGVILDGLEVQLQKKA